MDSDPDKKLRELIDRQEIWQVLLRYARGLDRLDGDMARSCYFDDAIDDHGHFIGKPADFVAWADAVTLRYVTTQHGLLNHYCELEGDDAHCETYFHFTATCAEPPHFMSVGRYIDHFQRRNGEWRIANRVVIVEGTFDVPDSLVSRQMPPAYGPDEIHPATRDRNDVSYHRPLRPRQPRGH